MKTVLREKLTGTSAYTKNISWGDRWLGGSASKKVIKGKKRET